MISKKCKFFILCDTIYFINYNITCWFIYHNSLSERNKLLKVIRLKTPFHFKFMSYSKLVVLFVLQPFHSKRIRVFYARWTDAVKEFPFWQHRLVNQFAREAASFKCERLHKHRGITSCMSSHNIVPTSLICFYFVRLPIYAHVAVGMLLANNTS